MVRTTAHCKLNLHLRVKGKRPDGFHDIESVFIPLAFGDKLTFELDGEGVDVTVDWKVSHDPIPIAENLVFRATELFRERTGWDGGVRISVEKWIPTGAGLGGGSADAAAVLRTLNMMTHAGLPLVALIDLAIELGSDVPFFLYGTPAFITGRGERVSPIRLRRELFASIIYPGFGIGTGGAFHRLDAKREVMGTDGQSIPNGEREVIKMFEKPLSEWRFLNDFLPVLLKGEHTSAYQAMLTVLKAADFCGLSGSGSCCFGIWERQSDMENFAERECVKKTLRKLEKNAKIINTRILSLAIKK
ncbi:MAG: 4-(cytidine 5'-diphospho)-2-C-methyl-D-erythritol kinase [Treponema sp.]|jgi:4-diphosphocytidyl-2-C-methyl-D-erythritol kinase|nr:4-(cytidine 5'-diphospho)-2-C-methyl-D-erythritol kinase [Treponema sp.]